MYFATIALRNAARRPLRSLLTASAIAIAVGAVVSLVGISSGFERSFLDLYKGSGIGLIVVRAGAKQRLASVLDERLGGRIRAIPGVRAAYGGLADVISFEEQGLYGVVVQGWVPGTAAFEHFRLDAGRALRAGDRKAVMIGAILAKNLAKGVGDTLEVYEGEVFEVVGVYQAGNVFEDGAMVIPLAELQRITGRPGQVTGFSVILDGRPGDALREGVRRRIEALEPNLHVMTTEEHVGSLSEIQVAKAMSWLTSAVALVVGAVGILNAMVMSVQERTREIGLLRAVGWRRGRVARVILIESVLLSVGGAALGSLAARLGVSLLTRVPAVNGLVDGRIAPVVFVLGLAIALAVGLVGGALPAYRASRMQPTAALRQE